jgi:hypothetical protein
VKVWPGLVVLAPGVLLVFGICAQQSAQRLNVADGFEGASLSSIWATDRFEAGAVQMESVVVRAGKQALAVTVRSRDEFEAGQNGNADSERAELREVNGLVSRQDRAYEYEFSMYFPKDFPVVPVRLVIAQWKQYCNGEGKPCSDDSPVLALRYIGGVLMVTQDIAHEQHVLYKEKAEFRGRWLDFRVRSRFTPEATGRQQVWLNGRQLVDFHGATADAEDAATGYSKPSVFFFKMGLYRNVMREPMMVYIDEYRKRELGHDEF